MAELWLTNPLDDVFSTSFKEEDSQFNRRTDFKIEVAKNARESVQLAIRNGAVAMLDTSVQVRIPTEAINCGITFECGAVRLIPALRETVCTHKRTMRTNLPGLLPESIEPAPIKIPEYTTRSFFITAETNENTIPGDYSFEIIVSYIDRTNYTPEEIVYPLNIRVYDVTLPSTEKSTYNHAQWVNFCGYSPDPEDVMLAETNEKIYGIKNFSEEWFTLVENLAKQMKKERINVVFVPLFSLLNRDIKFDSNGKYIFDFTLFDRFLDTFMEYGSIKYFIGCHLLKQSHQVPGKLSHDYEKTAKESKLVTWIFEENRELENFAWKFLDDDAAWKHLEMLIRALYAHLEEIGIEDRWIQCVSDECEGEERLAGVRKVYNKIHEWAPNFKTADATHDTSLENYGTSLDIHIPQLDVHEFNLEKYQEFQRKTDCEVWTYTCLHPKFGYLNRLDDLQLIATRLLHWYNYLFGATGYLNWAWNLWCYCDEYYSPFSNCSASHHPLDAWEVLPDVDNLNIFETIRSRQDASGIEDYELLTICDAIDHEQTKMLASILIARANDFTLDTNTFFRVRSTLFQIVNSFNKENKNA